MLIVLCFTSRVFASYINFGLPDMDPNYIRVARAIFEGRRGDDLYILPATYGSILYGLHSLTHSWVLSSHILYVTCSMASAWLMYLLARSMMTESIARHVLALAMLLPNYSSAVVGYSHTVVVGYLLVLITMFAFWQLCTDGTTLLWCVVATLSGGAAVLIRHEYVLIWPLFVLIWLWRSSSRREVGRRLFTAATMSAVGTSMLLLMSNVQRRVEPNEPIGLFGNERYSYLSYIDTLSIRATGEIDENVAMELARKAFGPAENLHYSIPRAMLRNPREATANVVFNIKEFLKLAGHPLFVPVFLLPLVGIGLMRQTAVSNPAAWPLLAAVVPVTLFTVLLIDVQIRYLMPLTLPLVVLMAMALDRLADDHPWIVRTVYVTLAILFIAYTFNVRRVGVIYN